MSTRPESGYQRQDTAILRGWLGDPEAGLAPDATLLAALLAITTGWRGFYPALELLPTSSPVPAGAPTPPAVVGTAPNPAACAAWRPSYGTDLSERRALTGGLLQGLPAILYMTLAVQPWVREDTCMRLAEVIRDQIARLARLAGWSPNPSVPVAQTFDVGSGWSGWSIMVRFWSAI